MKINLNYFVVNTNWQNLQYFLRRGHFFPLVWDRIKWHWFPRLRIVPSFPQTVDIETSLSCQLNCPMCTRAQFAKKDLQGLMSFSLFQKIIDECARHGTFSVKLSWRGEPTLNPRLVEMVGYAKEKGIRDVAFLTNGGLIDRTMTEKLIDAGLDWISFSIDGLYGDYEKIRFPIRFEQIVETVTTLRDMRNARGLKKPLIRVQTISGLVQRQPQYYSFWEPIADRIAVIAEQHREDPNLIDHDPSYICQSPFQRIFITWDGVVIPCHGDYHLHHDMGNVNDQQIQEIWQSKKFKQFRKDMSRGKRLNHKGCTICPDGGTYIKDHLKIGGRNIGTIQYINKPTTSHHAPKQT